MKRKNKRATCCWKCKSHVRQKWYVTGKWRYVCAEIARLAEDANPCDALKSPKVCRGLCWRCCLFETKEAKP